MIRNKIRISVITFIGLVLDVLPRAVKQENKSIRVGIREEKTKLSLFRDDTLIHVQKRICR